MAAPKILTGEPNWQGQAPDRPLDIRPLPTLAGALVHCGYLLHGYRDFIVKKVQSPDARGTGRSTVVINVVALGGLVCLL